MDWLINNDGGLVSFGLSKRHLMEHSAHDGYLAGLFVVIVSLSFCSSSLYCFNMLHPAPFASICLAMKPKCHLVHYCVIEIAVK
jgi:hypothetical protein